MAPGGYAFSLGAPAATGDTGDDLILELEPQLAIMHHGLVRASVLVSSSSGIVPGDWSDPRLSADSSLAPRPQLSLGRIDILSAIRRGRERERARVRIELRGGARDGVGRLVFPTHFAGVGGTVPGALVAALAQQTAADLAQARFEAPALVGALHLHHLAPTSAPHPAPSSAPHPALSGALHPAPSSAHQLTPASGRHLTPARSTPVDERPIVTVRDARPTRHPADTVGPVPSWPKGDGGAGSAWWAGTWPPTAGDRRAAPSALGDLRPPATRAEAAATDGAGHERPPAASEGPGPSPDSVRPHTASEGPVPAPTRSRRTALPTGTGRFGAWARRHNTPGGAPRRGYGSSPPAAWP